MKLKNMIIDNEYNEADNVPALTVNNKVNIVLHKDNKEEYSPYSTVNS